MQHIMQKKIAFVILFIALISIGMASSAHAEVITIEGTIEAVDAKKRTISVKTKTQMLELDVSRKAKVSVKGKKAKLDSLKVGQKVKLSYHDDLEIVLKIEASATKGASGDDKSISLLNGLNLSGWKYVKGSVVAERSEAWGFDPKSKVLKCKGLGGHAMLVTDEKYKNFTLSLEWRIPPGVKVTKDGLGVLVRAENPRTPQVRSIAFQLNDSNFAAVWVLGQSVKPLVGKPTKKFQNRLILNEKKPKRPIGEWNELEIKCIGENVTVIQNGKTVIQLTSADVISGSIGLRSQGTEMEIRQIRLTAH